MNGRHRTARKGQILLCHVLAESGDLGMLLFLHLQNGKDGDCPYFMWSLGEVDQLPMNVPRAGPGVLVLSKCRLQLLSLLLSCVPALGSSQEAHSTI